MISILSVLVLAGAPAAPAATPQPQPKEELTLSGPYAHDNLQVFLVHGKERLPGKKWLTLEEAMKKGVVKVHETGTVSSLAIENTGTDEVFVESGEIVKGGQQDRVVAFDVIVPAKSGKLPLSSFCVESGRWEKRGGENVGQFSGSDSKLSTKSLKLAARKDADQSKVWKEVATTQEKLKKSLGADVSSKQSPTSMQLTMENEKVKKTSDEYIKALASIVDGKEDVIGFAFAINGQVNSVDVYASTMLFRKLWAKQLKAAATEAIAEKTDKKSAPTTADAVKKVMADAQSGKKVGEKSINKRAKMTTQETDKNLMFETIDAESNEVIHINYTTK